MKNPIATSGKKVMQSQRLMFLTESVRFPRTALPKVKGLYLGLHVKNPLFLSDFNET
jgi:hypothetical protein